MSHISKDLMCDSAFVQNVYIPTLQHLLLEIGNLNCADHIHTHTQTHHLQRKRGFATMLILNDILHEWHIPYLNLSITVPLLHSF